MVDFSSNHKSLKGFLWFLSGFSLALLSVTLFIWFIKKKSKKNTIENQINEQIQ